MPSRVCIVLRMLTRLLAAVLFVCPGAVLGWDRITADNKGDACHGWS